MVWRKKILLLFSISLGWSILDERNFFSEWKLKMQFFHQTCRTSFSSCTAPVCYTGSKKYILKKSMFSKTVQIIQNLRESSNLNFYIWLLTILTKNNQYFVFVDPVGAFLSLNESAPFKTRSNKMPSSPLHLTVSEVLQCY